MGGVIQKEVRHSPGTSLLSTKRTSTPCPDGRAGGSVYRQGWIGRMQTDCGFLFVFFLKKSYSRQQAGRADSTQIKGA